jgi:phosphotransferase system enzyme I (PtsI)
VVKRVIRAASAADGRALLDRLLQLTTADEIEHQVRTEMTRRFGALLEPGSAPLIGPVAG